MYTSKHGTENERDNCSSIVNAEDLPIVLTVTNVAEILGVGKNTAYDLIRSGAVKSFRVGRQIRVSKSAFLDYLS